MKKLFLMLCVSVLLAVSCMSEAKAQCEFSQGSLGLNFGFGCGNSHYTKDARNWHNDFFVPTFNFALDYAILGNIINNNGSISAGGYFSMGKGSKKYNGVKFSDGRWRVGTRGALHYTWVNNLDTYAGVAIGFRNDKYKWDGNNDDTDPSVDFEAFAGARYKLGNFAIFSEVATTDFAYFQIGVSLVF